MIIFLKLKYALIEVIIFLGNSFLPLPLFALATHMLMTPSVLRSREVAVS